MTYNVLGWTLNLILNFNVTRWRLWLERSWGRKPLNTCDYTVLTTRELASLLLGFPVDCIREKALHNIITKFSASLHCVLHRWAVCHVNRMHLPVLLWAYLQWTMSRPASGAVMNLTRRMKSSRGVGWSGTPWSGQAVNWNCFTSRRSALPSCITIIVASLSFITIQPDLEHPPNVRLQRSTRAQSYRQSLTSHF